jgi:hypothetical protein
MQRAKLVLRVLVSVLLAEKLADAMNATEAACGQAIRSIIKIDTSL